MTPVQAFSEVGNLLELTVKRVYRDEPMTTEELDTWIKRIVQWGKEVKEGKCRN